jgi:sodium-dependent dicarboxylate transporter 2/3/5
VYAVINKTQQLRKEKIMETIKSMPTKKKIGAVVTILLLVLCALTPKFWAGDGAITVAGMRTILLLVSFLVMLVLEVLPVVVTSLLYVGLMPVLGIVSGLGAALTGYSNPVVFFTLASFGIAAALIKVPLSNRILAAMLRTFGNSIEKVLLALMVCCAIVSSLVSNVPCCAVFMALALNFLNLYKKEEDRKKTGRAFMIAIPVASMIGGMITPVGSSVNLIAMQQLTAAGYPEIGFVQWMCFGLPLAIVVLPVAWLLICKIYKPVEVTKAQVLKFADDMGVPEKIGTQEGKVLFIICVMLVLWILSSWVSGINTMVVAILGCVVLFLPGVDILDVDSFLKENSWDAFFLVGTVISISSAMTSNGVGSAIATAISSALPSSVSAMTMIAISAVIIFVCLIVIPVATSLIPLMLPVLITVAVGAGVSPTLITLVAAICACNCYLLPLDTVPLITYSKGYYSMTDMVKCTLWLQILIVALCTLWLPLMGNVFGM